MTISVTLGGRGGICRVDADIDPVLLSRRWRPDRDGYAVCTPRDGRTVFMHRRIANAPSGLFVDHIDRDRLNNTRSNLRVVTPLESTLNKGRRPGSSRFRGVCWAPKAGKWQVYLNQTYLGLYADEIEAAKRWLTESSKRYGAVAVAQDALAIALAEAAHG